MGSIINIDLNKEAKNQINNLVTKLETISFINNDGMNSPGDSDIPRLFYGTEDIMVLQTNTYNKAEYENIVEILDYWRKLYKDPNLGIDERNRLLDQIRETYLENETLLQHFNYDINMSTNEDDSQSSSSEETIDQDISSEINKGIRKAEKPIDPE